ncbi:MAG: hypothetical protein V7776_23195 [Halopseudomonas aestusnigri]
MLITEDLYVKNITAPNTVINIPNNAPALVVFTNLSISNAYNPDLSSSSVSIFDFAAVDILELTEGFSLPSGIEAVFNPRYIDGLGGDDLPVCGGV